MYQSFEELCFNLADTGRENIESIERMNVYKFYRYKEYLINKNSNGRDKDQS